MIFKRWWNSFQTLSCSVLFSFYDFSYSYHANQYPDRVSRCSEIVNQDSDHANPYPDRVSQCSEIDNQDSDRANRYRDCVINYH